MILAAKHDRTFLWNCGRLSRSRGLSCELLCIVQTFPPSYAEKHRKTTYYSAMSAHVEFTRVIRVISKWKRRASTAADKHETILCCQYLRVAARSRVRSKIDKRQFQGLICSWLLIRSHSILPKNHTPSDGLVDKWGVLMDNSWHQ